MSSLSHITASDLMAMGGTAKVKDSLTALHLSAANVLITQETSLHILEQTKDYIWNEMDLASLYWILHGGIAGNKPKFIYAMCQHPLICQISSARIKSLIG